MLCSICDLRRKHNNLQGPDKRKPDFAYNDIHPPCSRSGTYILDIVSVPSEGEGGEEGLSEDICSCLPRIFRNAAHISCRHTGSNAYALLDNQLDVTYIYNVHSCIRAERAIDMEKSSWSTYKPMRNTLPYLQQCPRQRRGFRKQHERHYADVSEQFELLALSWHIQACDSQIFSSDIHEVDLPVLRPDGDAYVVQGSHQPILDKNTVCPALGTGLPHRIRHIHKLFPDPCRSETDSSYSGEHVQLYTANNCHSDQHNHRNGYIDMAEASCCVPCIFRCICRKPQPFGRKIIEDSRKGGSYFI